jgi:hypothetical protein
MPSSAAARFASPLHSNITKLESKRCNCKPSFRNAINLNSFDLNDFRTPRLGVDDENGTGIHSSAKGDHDKPALTESFVDRDLPVQQSGPRLADQLGVVIQD